MDLVHLGYSGLSFTVAGDRVCVDPPGPGAGPTVLTWTETERVAGTREGLRRGRGKPGEIAADPAVLAWLGVDGVAVRADPVALGAWSIRALPYRPIPYATPMEALRKARCTLRAPRFALGRVAAALRRPRCPPLAIELTHDRLRVALLGQALHRFTTHEERARLVAWCRGAEVVVAGTDYEDEAATGGLLGAFGARVYVVADLTGAIRRRIGLPTRPIGTVLTTAPPGTRLLEVGETLRVD